MKDTVINIKDKLEKVDDFWKPKIIEQFNDYQMKVVKIKGQFTWHDHCETDEVFMVIKGEMTIMMRNKSVILKEGEFYVVPKGVEHKPIAKEECSVLLIEPGGTVNTGEVVNMQTASNTDWI